MPSLVAMILHHVTIGLLCSNHMAPYGLTIYSIPFVGSIKVQYLKRRCIQYHIVPGTVNIRLILCCNNNPFWFERRYRFH